MTTNQPRSVGGRFWWIIRTTLLIFIFVALVAVVLGGLGYAGFLGVKEIQRADESLLVRIEANEANLNSLRDLVDTELTNGDPEQQVQIDRLEEDVAALVSQLESLQMAQAEGTAVRGEEIGGLEAELAAIMTRNSDLADELESIQGALVALQSDLNEDSNRIDELGGDLDQLRLQLGSLDETLAEFSTTTAVRDGSSGNLQQSLTLLQLWGVLTNARLALLDGDEVAAETAVSQALVLSENLVAAPDSPAAAALTRLQTRLSLAADGFTTNLPMVARDLEAASGELNLLFSQPVPEDEVAEGTPAPTGTVTETAVPAVTPSPSQTPLPSTTPTATP